MLDPKLTTLLKVYDCLLYTSLLDEPLGALDLKLRQDMQYELIRLKNELGITFIYVTHDQEEALTMSDKVVVMNQGYIQQMGTPEEIYNEPENAFVADFIGDSNILNGIMLQDVYKRQERMRADGITDVLIQPTHMVNGIENERMKADALARQEEFLSLTFGEPLLSGTADCEAVIRAVQEEFSSLPRDEALVLMGHGTTPVSYTHLDVYKRQAGTCPYLCLPERKNGRKPCGIDIRIRCGSPWRINRLWTNRNGFF